MQEFPPSIDEFRRSADAFATELSDLKQRVDVPDFGWYPYHSIIVDSPLVYLGGDLRCRKCIPALQFEDRCAAQVTPSGDAAGPLQQVQDFGCFAALAGAGVRLRELGGLLVFGSPLGRAGLLSRLRLAGRNTGLPWRNVGARITGPLRLLYPS